MALGRARMERSEILTYGLRADLVEGKKVTTFEIPSLTTDRLRLRAFQSGALDAYAAMQADPGVMRSLVDGRTHTRVEGWRIMAGFPGS